MNLNLVQSNSQMVPQVDSERSLKNNYDYSTPYLNAIQDQNKEQKDTVQQNLNENSQIPQQQDNSRLGNYNSTSNYQSQNFLLQKNKALQDESLINSQRLKEAEQNVLKPEIDSLNNTIDGPQGKKKGKDNRTIVYNLNAEPLEQKKGYQPRGNKTTDQAYITIHLDTAGKYTIIFAYTIMQLACIFTYLVNINTYSNNICNPSVYLMPQVLIDQMQINITKENVFITCLVFAIFFKLASIVSLFVALNDYMQLNSNYTSFIFTILMCVAPTSLMAPFFVYDHDNCIPRNFIVNLNLACQIQICCFLISIGPLFLLIFTPSTLGNIFYCKKDEQKKISPQLGQDPNENQNEQDKYDKNSVTQQLSKIISILLNILTVLASIALFLVMLLIHIATYRLFQGEILASGGNNEILSILQLLVYFCMFNQREYTYEEMKKWEEDLNNENNEVDKIIVIEKGGIDQRRTTMKKQKENDDFETPGPIIAFKGFEEQEIFMPLNGEQKTSLKKDNLINTLESIEDQVITSQRVVENLSQKIIEEQVFIEIAKQTIVEQFIKLLLAKELPSDKRVYKQFISKKADDSQFIQRTYILLKEQLIERLDRENEIQNQKSRLQRLSGKRVKVQLLEQTNQNLKQLVIKILNDEDFSKKTAKILGRFDSNSQEDSSDQSQK